MLGNLFEARRQCVGVQRPHRSQGPEHDQVQRPPQEFNAFLVRHALAFLVENHSSLSTGKSSGAAPGGSRLHPVPGPPKDAGGGYL